MATHFSVKHLQVDKANAVVVASSALAMFVVIFSIVACRALLSQRSYQSRVITAQEAAVKQLHDNVKAVDKLKQSYAQFTGQPTNILGANASGPGDSDGDNAKIILDALPSKYDFPALATSLEKILIDRNIKIDSITGTDDEIAQDASHDSTVPIEMPFSISVTSSYDSLQGLLDIMQRSIRPINIQALSFSGKNSSLQMNLTAATYYLPEKQLIFPTKVIK